MSANITGWEPIAGAILTAAGILAGALKLLAGSISRSADRHGRTIDRARESIDRNTEAVRSHTRAFKGAGLLFALLLLLPGCVSDPMAAHIVRRNHQVWEEDRRADLDPDLVESRRREFAAQLNYLGGGDASR